jgi:hypothetical protein
MASDRFSRFGTAPESPPDERDYEIRSFLNMPSTRTTLVLPDEVGTINVEVHREVGITDQGQEGSCTGHAFRNTKAVTERRTRSRSMRRRVPDFGPRGIYTLAKTTGGYPEEEGAYMRDVVKAADHYGVPREKDWPYLAHTDERGQTQDVGTPIARWLTNARRWRIGAYARVLGREDAHGMAAVVLPRGAGRDVATVVRLHERFGEAHGDEQRPHLVQRRQHLLQRPQSERRFLVPNSWGTGWGDAGYCWIDFDHFLSRARSEAWAVPDMV